MGCPVICFEDTGGAAELASVGGAMAVPYLDAAAMASAVAVNSPAKRTRLEPAGRRIVGEANDPEKVAKRIGIAVSQCVTESTR